MRQQIRKGMITLLSNYPSIKRSPLFHNEPQRTNRPGDSIQHGTPGKEVRNEAYPGRIKNMAPSWAIVSASSPLNLTAMAGYIILHTMITTTN